MRVMALISMVMLSISNATLKPRLAKGRSRRPLQSQSPAFTIYCFATLVAFLEIYTGNGSPISKKKMLTDPYHSFDIHRYKRLPYWRISRLCVLPR